MNVIASIRWTAVFSIVAALFLVPVSISPAGNVEIDGACASSECRSKVGAHCYDDGVIYPDARIIFTQVD